MRISTYCKSITFHYILCAYHLKCQTYRDAEVWLLLLVLDPSLCSRTSLRSGQQRGPRRVAISVFAGESKFRTGVSLDSGGDQVPANLYVFSGLVSRIGSSSFDCRTLLVKSMKWLKELKMQCTFCCCRKPWEIGILKCPL